MIENELRGDLNRYKFHELDGHDFSKKNSTDRHNSTSSASSSAVPSVLPSSSEPEVKIEYLKFVGSQLLAVSENSNKMAVWNAARQGRWQQHSTPEKVLCLESVSTFVYMGSGKGKNTEGIYRVLVYRGGGVHIRLKHFFGVELHWSDAVGLGLHT